MRNPHPTKGDKREARQEMHLTRPPRLEGKTKEAKMQPKRKKKAPKAPKRAVRKPQGKSTREIKNYQLRSSHH